MADVPKPMTNKEVVIAFLDAGHRADLPVVATLICDDIIKYGPRPSSPYSAPVQGRENFLASYHHEIYKADSIHMEVERILAEKELVDVQFILRAITASGEPYENYYHFLFECENFKVKKYWEYVDTQYAHDKLFADHVSESDDPT